MKRSYDFSRYRREHLEVVPHIWIASYLLGAQLGGRGSMMSEANIDTAAPTLAELLVQGRLHCGMNHSISITC